MLTHAALTGMLRDAIGVAPDQPIAAGYSETDVINLAGRWLSATHEWAWQARAVTTLDFVAGQEYISLPSDFRSLGTVTLTNGLVHRARLTTMDVLVKYRTESVADFNDRWLAISYRPDANGTRLPVLEIYPTPSTAGSAAMTLYYAGGWATMAEGVGHAPIPEFMDPLLMQAVREYGMGLAEEGGAGLIPRLDALKQSEFFRSFRRQDGQSQDEYGTLMNTSGSDATYHNDPPFVGPYLSPS